MKFKLELKAYFYLAPITYPMYKITYKAVLTLKDRSTYNFIEDVTPVSYTVGL